MATYTNKTYVAFDADNDIRYYRLMQAWKKNDNTSFNFYDAHDLNNLMSYSSEETIKAKLAERLRNTKVFILLVGNTTKNLYKFVRWEVEQAIKRNIPIIGDLCINRNNHQKPTFHPLGDFLNPALALLGQGLKKSPIGQKLDFANHPYLCKGLYCCKFEWKKE